MDTCGRATTETDGRAGPDTVLVIYTNTQYMPMLLRQLRKYVLQPGEEAFTPMVRQYRWFHGTQTLVTRTLFPGYLFIQVNEKLDFYLRVKQSMGQVIFRYCSVLHDNEYILPLSLQEAREIGTLCGQSHILEPSRGYMDQGHLVITDGPLKKLEETIIRVDRHKKTAEIQIHFLGQTVRIHVGLEINEKPGESEETKS